MKNKKNISKYAKLALAIIMITISTRDNSKELKKAIDEFKNKGE